MGYGWRTYPEDPKDNKEYYLEEVPISIVSDLEQHQLARSEGIHPLGSVS